jgi:hypothetical protein
MTKHRPSPSEARDREPQFEKLLAAMGIDESADPFMRYPLTEDLLEIGRSYARQVAASAKQPDRKLVHRFRATVAKLLSLSRKIGPDFFSYELEKAGWSRQNPHADDSTLDDLVDETGHRRNDVNAVLTECGLNVDHWLKTSGEVYRKRDVRKRAVEPFLLLITRYEINTSRKRLPRKRMFDALFDWLGIERKFRPTGAAINTIARDLAGRPSLRIKNQKSKSKTADEN